MKPLKHHELRAWQQGVALATAVYEITDSFPSSEPFGLSQQIRRCAVSIPSNIAEGAARGSDKDFLRFMYIARGSLSELETQLYIAGNLGFLDLRHTPTDAMSELFSSLGGLIKHLEQKAAK